MRCPKCRSSDKQHKVGTTRASSQRYRCYLCSCKYKPVRKAHGYSAEHRRKAIRLYVDGMNLRRIGGQLKVNPQSVANWVKAHAELLQPATVPTNVAAAELDELFTFIGAKKNRIYLLTNVDRATRCVLGWKIVWECIRQDLQRVVNEGPKARRYFSDAFESYASLWFHLGRYAVSEGKTETYSVEADIAELRHYLARLARSSRCFSHCPYALHCAIRLFVYCYNHRQLKSCQFPNYTFHLIDFVDRLI